MCASCFFKDTFLRPEQNMDQDGIKFIVQHVSRIKASRKNQQLTKCKKRKFYNVRGQLSKTGMLSLESQLHRKPNFWPPLKRPKFKKPKFWRNLFDISAFGFLSELIEHIKPNPSRRQLFG